MSTVHALGSALALRGKLGSQETNAAAAESEQGQVTQDPKSNDYDVLIWVINKHG